MGQDLARPLLYPGHRRLVWDEPGRGDTAELTPPQDPEVNVEMDLSSAGII
jgi:hypothetical protein